MYIYIYIYACVYVHIYTHTRITHNGGVSRPRPHKKQALSCTGNTSRDPRIRHLAHMFPFKPVKQRNRCAGIC